MSTQKIKKTKLAKGNRKSPYKFRDVSSTDPQQSCSTPQPLLEEQRQLTIEINDKFNHESEAKKIVRLTLELTKRHLKELEGEIYNKNDDDDVKPLNIKREIKEEKQ